VLPCSPIPGFLLERVEAGGLLPQLKRRLAARTEEPRP
jgi:3-isopropylmalate/(R)-2-methylmalate dehydratase small subunit